MCKTLDKLNQEAFSLMDDANVELQNGNVNQGLNTLAFELNNIRQRISSDDWDDFINGEVLQHPIFPTIQEDPMTKHSFIKPRNYAGDAELIDYMYGLRTLNPDTTELGKAIYDWSCSQNTIKSVRARREIIASMIDEVASESKAVRMLSIACGHLREAEISDAVQSCKINQFFALDQDELSLEVVKAGLSQFNIIPVNAPFSTIFTNGKQLQGQDFVYAAGLYDYLNQRISAKLTQKMFELLNPGGRMLVANFAPSLPDIAYGEMFLRWKLIYRTVPEVADFARLIPKDEIARQKIFWDEPQNVIYLEIIKK